MECRFCDKRNGKMYVGIIVSDGPFGAQLTKIGEDNPICKTCLDEKGYFQSSGSKEIIIFCGEKMM